MRIKSMQGFTVLSHVPPHCGCLEKTDMHLFQTQPHRQAFRMLKSRAGHRVTRDTIPARITSKCSAPLFDGVHRWIPWRSIGTQILFVLMLKLPCTRLRNESTLYWLDLLTSSNTISFQRAAHAGTQKKTPAALHDFGSKQIEDRKAGHGFAPMHMTLLEGCRVL